MVERTLILLDRLHWLWLLIAMPFLLFPSPKSSPVILVIPALFLLRWAAIRAKAQKAYVDVHAKNRNQLTIIPSTPLNGALLLMFIMVLVSLWVTFDINYSLPKISGMLLGIGAFLAVAREGRQSRGMIFSLLAFFIIGLAIAVLGLLGTSWFSNKILIFGPITARLPRLISGIQGAESGFHPNEVAGGLIWVLPLILAVSYTLVFRRSSNNVRTIGEKGWCRKFWGIGATFFCLGASLFIATVFLLCQSRSGYIGLALTFIILVPVALPTKWRWFGLIILFLLAIISGYLVASHWESVRTWITGSKLTADPVFSLDTLAGRVEVWSRAIYGIQDFPFTGMGMNAFRKVVPVLYPLFNISPDMDIGHAHNEFLQAALDLGIPGLISFLALYIGSFWMLLNIWRVTRIKISGGNDYLLVTRLLTLGLAGSLLAHLLFGMTDAVALGAKPGILFWLLMGLVTALHQQVQDHIAGKDNNVPLPDDLMIS